MPKILTYHIGMSVDLFVIGGGVGALWGGPVGWAAFALIPATSQTVKLCDGSPNARVDDADVMPFAAAIQWWHNQHWKPEGTADVLCVSDSPGVIAAGRSPELRDPQSDWRFIQWFEDRGYSIQWQWEPRDRHLEVYEAAKAVRETFRGTLPRTSIPGSS